MGALAEKGLTRGSGQIDAEMAFSGSNLTGPQNLLIGSFPAAGDDIASFDDATRQNVVVNATSELPYSSGTGSG